MRQRSRNCVPQPSMFFSRGFVQLVMTIYAFSLTGFRKLSHARMKSKQWFYHLPRELTAWTSLMCSVACRSHLKGMDLMKWTSLLTGKDHESSCFMLPTNHELKWTLTFPVHVHPYKGLAQHTSHYGSLQQPSHDTPDAIRWGVWSDLGSGLQLLGCWPSWWPAAWGHTKPRKVSPKKVPVFQGIFHMVQAQITPPPPGWGTDWSKPAPAHSRDQPSCGWPRSPVVRSRHAHSVCHLITPSMFFPEGSYSSCQWFMNFLQMSFTSQATLK